MEDKELFEALRGYDTPSVCNAIEIVAGARRGTGFTRRPMVMPNPKMGPFVGRARTATLRATERQGAGGSADRRIEYYRYVAEPGAVVVIEDLDDEPGVGAFWGEVNTTVHAALGVAGVVTNGSVRDLDVLHPDLPLLAGAVSPSHAFADIEETGAKVTVCGMEVAPGAAVHADRHGAVAIEEGMLAELPKALDTMVRRERVVIDAAKRAGFGVDDLEKALRESRDIH